MSKYLTAILIFAFLSSLRADDTNPCVADWEMTDCSNPSVQVQSITAPNGNFYAKCTLQWELDYSTTAGYVTSSDMNGCNDDSTNTIDFTNGPNVSWTINTPEGNTFSGTGNIASYQTPDPSKPTTKVVSPGAATATFDITGTYIDCYGNTQTYDSGPIDGGAVTVDDDIKSFEGELNLTALEQVTEDLKKFDALGGDIQYEGGSNEWILSFGVDSHKECCDESTGKKVFEIAPVNVSLDLGTLRIYAPTVVPGLYLTASIGASVSGNLPAIEVGCDGNSAVFSIGIQGTISLGGAAGVPGIISVTLEGYGTVGGNGSVTLTANDDNTTSTAFSGTVTASAGVQIVVMFRSFFEHTYKQQVCAGSLGIQYPQAN